MAFGLNVFNASGQLSVSTEGRLVRYYGAISIASMSAHQQGTVSVPGMAADGTWFAFGHGYHDWGSQYGGINYYALFISISSGLMVLRNPLKDYIYSVYVVILRS